MKIRPLILLIMLCYLPPVLAADSTPTDKSRKADYDNEEGFAGPGSTVRQLEEDDEEKSPALRFEAFDEALGSWFEGKKAIYDISGLQLGFAYNLLHQEIDESLGDEDSATSSIFRVSGKWEVYNRGKKNKGQLVFSFDNRNNLSDVPPGSLGGEAGYIGQTGALFSGVDTILGDFYWSQYLNEGRTGLIVGRYDPNDFFDVLGYANPWTSFQNLSILFNTSIALPDWGFGIGAGHWFEGDQIYLFGSASDANAVLTKEEFEFDTDELYKTVEIGWSPGRDQRYFRNLHVTLWQVDEREDAGIDDADGVTLGINWTWDNTWMLFAKIGASDADAPNDPQIAENSVTIGGIYYFANRSDLVGIAYNDSELAADGFDDQTTLEAFYRLQLAQNLAITPSLQIIGDPALNPDEDEITVIGLRLRLTL
ncbi:MAG: carbohydrate porin [Gammaproteobacteria bacterium]|nr:carbohydrate porin [Gammaproteobacteria bacterium]